MNMRLHDLNTEISSVPVQKRWGKLLFCSVSTELKPQRIRTASNFIALLPSRSVRQMLVACEQALLFGRVKRVSRERASG